MEGSYIGAAATTFGVAFVPIFELYIAVPTGLAMGLDPFSAVLFTVVGNYAPVLLVHFGFDVMMKRGRLAAWLRRKGTSRWKQRLETGGPFWIFFLTPLAGVWALAVTAKMVRLDARLVLLWSLASIAFFSALCAVLIALGLDFVGYHVNAL